MINLAIYIEFNESFTGGPRVAYNLVRVLDRQRFNPVVLTNRNSEMTDAMRALGIEPVVLEQPKRIGDDDGASLQGGLIRKSLTALDIWRYNRRVAKVLRKNGVRCLWVRNIKGVLLTALAARWCKTPLVWDIGMEKPSRGMVRKLHNFGFKTAARVVTEGSFVAPSIFDETQLSRFGSKIVVNTPALSNDRVNLVRRDAMTPLNEGERFTVLNVASVNDRKNQMMLVRSIRELKDRFPRLHVRIAGPVADEAYGLRLHDYIRDNALQDHVELLGWRTDIPELLHTSHMFTLSSRVEGIPQSILEAMYARVPVVATAAGGVPDIVRNHETGWLVAIDDQSAYTDALADCLANANKRLAYSEEAYRLASETVTAEQWSGRYVVMFEELIAGKR